MRRRRRLEGRVLPRCLGVGSFEELVAHELGHVLGFRHVSDWNLLGRRQARALTYDQARELMLAARDRRRRGRGLESEATAARRALVDAVVVALLFCGGLRRAEASALVWADVEPIWRSDESSGMTLYLPLCPRAPLGGAAPAGGSIPAGAAGGYNARALDNQD